jgi:hypothetical protein
MSAAHVDSMIDWLCAIDDADRSTIIARAVHYYYHSRCDGNFLRTLTHPKAQPPGPPGGAGSASVRDQAGETEVSKASQRR